MLKNKLLGFDIGGTNLRVGLVEEGRILNVFQESIADKNNEQGTLDQVINMIGQVMTPEVVSIGVGVPSVVDLNTGIVYDTVNIPSWKKVPLKDLLTKAFGKPVFINNDANCFALGEKHFGIGKNIQNLTGLIIGTGVGAGLIMNNKLVSGHNCGAGEFGMAAYLGHDYEYFCGGANFETLYGHSAVDAYNLALSGDPDALNLWSIYGSHLAELIKLILYTSDPQLIVLGGSLSQAYTFFSSSLKQSLQSFAYKNSLKNLSIHISELENAGVLGAASLYSDSNI